MDSRVDITLEKHTLNMATLPLKSSCNERMLLFVRFLWAKGLNANAIHSEMCPVYGCKCFTRPAIHVWCRKFAHGREGIVDKKRPGRRVVAMTNATIATVDPFVLSDRLVSILVIVRHTGIS